MQQAATQHMQVLKEVRQQRSRYFSLYSNEMPQNLYYQQSSQRNQQLPQSSQTVQNSAQKHPQQIQLSQNNCTQKELKSLHKERIKRKQNSIQIIDYSTQQHQQQSPQSLMKFNTNPQQEAKRLNYKRMNISFKDKRESLLRIRSQERSDLANSIEGDASKLVSTIKLSNCQQKLKIFEQQWSLFKENFENQHSNQRSQRSQERIADNHGQSQAQLKVVQHDEQEADIKVKRKNQRSVCGGIVDSFYRTRSQSPGLKQLATDSKEYPFKQAVNILNQSLRQSSKAIKNPQDERFEERVMQQIKNIQHSFFNSASTPSRNNICSSQGDANINHVSVLRQPVKMANYFSTASSQDHQQYRIQLIEQKTQEQPSAFQVRMNAKTYEQPQPKRQMSEKSLVKFNCTQSSLGGAAVSNNGVETKDSQIEQVKRSFMTKYKNMTDKNKRLLQQQPASYSTEDTSDFYYANNSIKLVSNLKTNSQNMNKLKKLSSKIFFKQADGDNDTATSSEIYTDSQHQKTSKTTLKQSDSRSTLNSTLSSSRLHTPLTVLNKQKSPRNIGIKVKSINLLVNQPKTQCSFTLNKKIKA